jgi:drug/metabolite transporter (DMT)-like permease
VTSRDSFDLVLLAALWGGSFLFMRLGAPEFGPVAMVALRVALAALVLLPLLAIKGLTPDLRAHWRPIAMVGLVNTAIPFVLFTYAALHITAGLSSVFNATAPLWGALVAWAWLGDKLTPTRTLGLAVGFAGVLWLGWDKAGFKPGAEISSATLSVLACLGATFFYGVGANLAKRHLAGVAPLAVAAGSQSAAALLLAVPAWWWWPAQTPAPAAWLWVGLLGVLCTAWAYVLFFRLIARIGPARAISVTFLIPLFGVLWGGIFLGERVTPVMLAAGAVVLLGTALATGLIKPTAWRVKRKDA